MKFIKHEKANSCMTDPLANLSVIGCFQIAEETVTELMGKLKIDGITVKKAYNFQQGCPPLQARRALSGG